VSLQVVVNFNVIAECEDWIVVDKPAPLIVHPANRKPEPTLLGGLENLLAYERATGACLAIVNRLDRDTSGVVLVAKSTAAARELGGIFERREAKKEYLAIVVGWPTADEWECEESILRAGVTRESLIWVRQEVSASGRHCHTRFKVKARFERGGERYAMIRCFPETGRMHQIRVHLAHTGFPIVGDKLYLGEGAEYIQWMADGWSADLEKKLLLPRHALHAAVLEIPWKDSRVRWEAPLPQDLVEFSTGNLISITPNVVIWSRHD